MITVTTTGDRALAAALSTGAARLEDKVRVGTAQFAALLAERIQTAASGRPGPNIVSGALVSSIEISHGSGGWGEATVGTNSPYANRLEFGFYGTDSIGRNYNQPPYPFFGRAVEGSIDEFRQILMRAIAGGI